MSSDAEVLELLQDAVDGDQAPPTQKVRIDTNIRRRELWMAMLELATVVPAHCVRAILPGPPTSTDERDT